ncbi:MAG TPA: hypothetical protein IAC11_09470 [Candidatus Limiplasma pullicola]|nr:hypothetical protein [Candidatus Limiplasma pullicola]
MIPAAGTQFLISSRLDVTAAAGISLLFDDVIHASHAGGVTDYGKRLKEKAAETAASDFKNVQCQAKYLNLVDARNVWLTPAKEVTVYWPYPCGTDADTGFRLVHFEGLNRELNIFHVEQAVEMASAQAISAEKDACGIRFTTDSFSPFVLMREGPGQPSPPATGWGFDPPRSHKGWPVQRPGSGRTGRFFRRFSHVTFFFLFSP